MSSPRYDRLFHVLVVLGGASGLVSCAGDDTTGRDRQVDAATSPADAGPTADAGPDGAGLDPCFCDVGACCDRTGDTPVLQSGFECCWSTTCD